MSENCSLEGRHDDVGDDLVGVPKDDHNDSWTTNVLKHM